MSIFGRAATILDIVAEGRGRSTLTDLAMRSGLPRSTVHRIVQELEREYFVIRQSPTGGYALGPALLKFGINGHLQLVSGMRPTLTSLAQAVNENVELAMFSGREVVVVDQVVSTTRLQAVSQVGKNFSFHGSCVGKALLATLPVSQVRAVLPDVLVAHTRHTIVDIERFLQELEDVRRTGVAFDREEHDVGISAVAVCVRTGSGVPQAVAVVAPTQRFEGRHRLFVERLIALQHRAEARSAVLHHPRPSLVGSHQPR